MSSHIFTYQHTCKRGKEAYILHHAAFRSVGKKWNGEVVYPFLGEGYYYWEENTVAAHRWGKRQYANDYNIVEYKDANISKDQLLDFLNRRDLAYYNELIAKFKLRRPDSENWLPAKWIEFFKVLEKTQPGIFPFRYFRADENLPTAEENDEIKNKTLLSFKGYHIYLNPHIILCAIDKHDLNCKDKYLIA